MVAAPEDRDSQWHFRGWLPYLATAPLFLTVGVILFLPALRAYFVCDDFLHLAEVIQGRLPFAPIEGSGRFLRPIIGLSFVVEYTLWGLYPLGYHLANVLAHIANSLLVALIAHGLLPAGTPRRTFVALGSGAIFLVLACHAEPVAWVSGRTDVYAAFFMLLSLASARRGLESQSLSWAGGAPPFLLLSLVGLGLALLTKESALALPFLFFLLTAYLRVADRIRLTPRIRLWLVSVAALLAGYFLLRYAILGTFIGGYGARGHLRMSRDILAQATSRHAWRTFFPPLPDGLTEFFAANATVLGLLWMAFLAAIFIGLSLRAWFFRKAGLSLWLFCAFWTALLPVINVRIYWTNPEGERFVYLASVFGAIALGYGIGRIPWRVVRWSTLAAVIGLQAYWLHGALRGWEQAGSIAADIVGGIQSQYDGGRVILVNKPDSYDGHLVLRTGLPEALHYFGEEPLPASSVSVLYAGTLFQPDHGFLLEEAGDGVYRISATDPTSVMVEEDRGDLVETLETDSRRITFRFQTPLRDATLFYYDRGRVRLVQ